LSDSRVWLGLDLGTQSARALAVSGSGAPLACGSCPLHSRRDGARHEQDPEEWWSALATACREAIAGLAGRSVAGLALCGTSGTIVLVDQDGEALTPGVMYDDGRATGEVERVAEAGAELWDALGYRMQPSWALPKLLWLLRERPDELRGAGLAHQVDFVLRRLVGPGVPSDSSHALKTGYDLLDDSWPHEVMSALGVPDGLLPDVVAPGTRLGEVNRAGAEATGIAEGTTVWAGMTDGCAAQIAAGALAVGSWNSVLGTTLGLKGVTPELLRDPLGTIYSHRSPDGHWLPGGASSTGAGVLSARFPDADLEALDRLAAEEPIARDPRT
jgi:sugar (pentulose or hexulose) kinase